MSELFKKAVKVKSKLRLALVGPSGSGKTWSALELAVGLGGKIALIDTEHGSASLYSDKFNFDVCELTPPFGPEKYIKAIHEASAYDILIIDSLSHAWAGEGGLLEQVDAKQRAGGNKFTAWAPATELQNKFINTILGCQSHIIATFRAKQEYAMEVNAKGKTEIRKLGMAPVQREGVEYEFAVVLDIGMDHMAKVGMSGKDRTRLFVDREAAALTAKDGKRLADWLDSGEAAKPAADEPAESDKPFPEIVKGYIAQLHDRPDVARLNEMMANAAKLQHQPTKKAIWTEMQAYVRDSGIKAKLDETKRQFVSA